MSDITIDVTYFEKYRIWAETRGIKAESDAETQFIKGLSEFGEMAQHVGKNKLDMLKDDIGDLLVCLTNAFAQDNIAIESLFSEDTLDIEYYEDHSVKELVRAVLSELSYINEVILEDSSLGSECLASFISILGALAKSQGWTLNDCMEAAWNDIKDRKGMMCNGTFIKEADLNVGYVKELLTANLSDTARTYLETWLTTNA